MGEKVKKDSSTRKASVKKAGVKKASAAEKAEEAAAPMIETIAGDESTSREVPPPSSDPTLWTKVRDGLKEGYRYTADKTDIYARVGKRRLAIVGINRNIDRSYTELGEKVYNILAAEGGDAVEGDLAVNELFQKIKMLEGELTDKEADIEQILQENRSGTLDQSR